MSLTLILTLVPHPNGGVHPELDQVSEKIPEHECIDGRSVPRIRPVELKNRRFGPSSTTMHRVCSNSSNWMSLKTKPASSSSLSSRRQAMASSDRVIIGWSAIELKTLGERTRDRPLPQLTVRDRQ